MRFTLMFLISMFVSCSFENDGSPSGTSPKTPRRKPTIPGGLPGDPVEQQTYLVFHNLKRCWHNVGSVTWNQALADSAKAHAARCTYAKDENFSLGESVGIGNDQIKALDDWYMEFLKFPFGKPNGTQDSQRFSQMVWKSTTEIGCGSFQCPRGKYFVCRYADKGNIVGEFDKNVLWLKPDFMTCSGTRL